jgi:hypothetical protein
VKKVDVGDAGLRMLTSLTRLSLLDVRATRVVWSDVSVLQNLPLLVNLRTDPRPNNADAPVAAGGGMGIMLGGGEENEEQEEEE